MNDDQRTVRAPDAGVPALDAVDVALGAAGALVALLALAGPTRADLFGVRVSLRDWRRPAVALLVLIVLRLWRATARRDQNRGWLDVACHAARIGLWAIVLLMPALWLVHLDVSSGGLDSAGYIGEAALFLRRTLI